MNLTDIFIKRPVLASVISLMILVLGLRSIASLELRQYPKTENTLVTVRTTYPGASSELVKGFITTPLQQAIAEADGIDFLKSTSKQGISIIEAYMELNYDPNAAVAEIQAKVASQRNVLPEEANDPVIDSQTGTPLALMYLAFHSETMSPPEMTDYLIRVVRPQLQALPGVAKTQIFGAKTYAMRIWLNPRRMAAMNVTAADVRRVLLANNYLSGAGETKGEYVAVDLSATTDISTVDEFRDLVVREETGVIVRLSDVARIELGAEDYESTAWYNGNTALFIGISPTPGANPLTVAERVRTEMPDIRTQMPSGLSAFIPYDASEFIQESIEEVFATLAEAVLIVLAVILLTLGSVRAALIPAVAIPLSLIGGVFLMLLMGFSINLLTLLAMVLRHWFGGRRRDRHRREHSSTRRKRAHADRSRTGRRAPATTPDHRHDDNFDRRLRTHRLHGWVGRDLVHRIRFCPGGRRADFRRSRAHAIADVVFSSLQGRQKRKVRAASRAILQRIR